MTDTEDMGSNMNEMFAGMPEAEPKAKAAPKVRATKAETVRIILEENDAIPPTGLFVGLNGRGYLLKTGEELDVPLGVKGILDDAIMATPQFDPDTRQVIGYKSQRRYSYRTVSA